MNLKIQLKDPKYCDGCPMNVWDMLWNNGNKCLYFEKKLTEWKYKKPNEHNHCFRPQKCIEENGE